MFLVGITSLFFSRLQLREARRQAEIAQAATTAAQKSAEAAKAALHANRPYVLMTEMAPASWKDQAFDRQPPIRRVNITFQNVGSSPAEIIDVFATSKKFEWLRDPSEPAWDKLNSGGLGEIGTPVLGTGPSEKMTLPIFVNWTKDDITSVDAGDKRVGIYGMIRYRGGPTEPYYTRFFWWFSPFNDPTLKKASSPELNERT